MIDPTKVVRTALQNAASVASLLLTTEAGVAEKPKKKAGAAAAAAACAAWVAWAAWAAWTTTSSSRESEGPEPGPSDVASRTATFARSPPTASRSA